MLPPGRSHPNPQCRSGRAAGRRAAAHHIAAHRSVTMRPAGPAHRRGRLNHNRIGISTNLPGSHPTGR
jgi:hypothetical protein